MNVVSSSLYMIRCWGFGGSQALAQCDPLDQLPRGKGQQEEVGIPGLLQEAVNSAPCHQQLPILGIKYTGAQELGYRP